MKDCISSPRTRCRLLPPDPSYRLSKTTQPGLDRAQKDNAPPRPSCLILMTVRWVSFSVDEWSPSLDLLFAVHKITKVRVISRLLPSISCPVDPHTLWRLSNFCCCHIPYIRFCLLHLGNRCLSFFGASHILNRVNLFQVHVTRNGEHVRNIGIRQIPVAHVRDALRPRNGQLGLLYVGVVRPGPLARTCAHLAWRRFGLRRHLRSGVTREGLRSAFARRSFWLSLEYLFSWARHEMSGLKQPYDIACLLPLISLVGLWQR